MLPIVSKTLIKEASQYSFCMIPAIRFSSRFIPAGGRRTLEWRCSLVGIAVDVGATTVVDTAGTAPMMVCRAHHAIVAFLEFRTTKSIILIPVVVPRSATFAVTPVHSTVTVAPVVIIAAPCTSVIVRSSPIFAIVVPGAAIIITTTRLISTTATTTSS